MDEEVYQPLQLRAFRNLILFLALLAMTGCQHKPPVMHRLERGQTLYTLAHVYGVSVEEIMRSNQIHDPPKKLP